jgi:hypothetical protein
VRGPAITKTKDGFGDTPAGPPKHPAFLEFVLRFGFLAAAQ